MSYPADQIAELKRLCDKVSSAKEGGVPYLLLEGLTLPAGLTPSKVDALLCPVVLENYHSRLFFAKRPAGGKSASLNWHVTGRVILDRPWDAYSYQLGSTDHRLAQLVALHLKAFR